MLRSENMAIVKEYADQIWHQGNLDAVDDFFAADYVRYSPYKPKITGIAAMKQFVSATRAEFPDLQFIWDDLIVEADKVVGRWTCRGTHLGPAPEFGIGPTGQQVEFAGISIYEIKDSKIVAEWEIWDRLRLLHQLGVVPVTKVYAE
jgi:predicted ester cyclase